MAVANNEGGIMSMECKRCEGEGTFSAWYANDSTCEVRYSLDTCSCTGFESPHIGERKITPDEFNRLRVLWEKAKASLQAPIQAAA